MGKIIQEKVEDTFYSQNLTACELSILIGMDSLAYIISDAQHQVQALKEIRFEDPLPSFLEHLKITIDQDSRLNGSYSNIRIGFFHPQFILIPERLFKYEERAIYLKEAADLGADYAYLVDDLGPSNIKNIYAVQEEVVQFLRVAFPGSRFSHITSIFSDSIKRQRLNNDKDHCYLNIRSGQAILLFFKGNDLQFANVYSFKLDKDLLYFVLLVYNQFNLNPENVPLTITGELSKQGSIYKLLQRYIRNILFAQSPALLKIGTQLNTLPRHYYYDLFNLLLSK